MGRELEFWQLVEVYSKKGEEVRVMYPDRDWDEEELDEVNASIGSQLFFGSRFLI